MLANSRRDASPWVTLAGLVAAPAAFCRSWLRPGLPDIRDTSEGVLPDLIHGMDKGGGVNEGGHSRLDIGSME